MTFQDHFSIDDAYARHRPVYPEELIAWLASLCPRRDLAWDSAAGNGQAAVPLGRYFSRVAATDASREQLRHAFPGEALLVRALSERAPFRNASVDLTVVAQALHWFDRDAFYREVRRVSRPGAAIAVWCYGLLEVEPAIDAAIRKHYTGPVGSYWLPQRELVDTGYRSLEFPFPGIPAPRFSMKGAWDLDALLGYVGTWSAVKRYREATGRDPLPEIAGDLAPLWGSGTRPVRWPLYVYAGRVEG